MSYFFSIFHVLLKKSVCNFLFYHFSHFCYLVRNEHIKRPGFNKLQLTRAFSNFSQLKQLSKIKNACEYCDLLEL